MDALKDEEAKRLALEQLVGSLRDDLSRGTVEMTEVRAAAEETRHQILKQAYEAKDSLRKDLLTAQEESRVAAVRERGLRNLLKQQETELETARLNHSDAHQRMQQSHSELKSSSGQALKNAILRAKSAELESARLVRELAIKDDELFNVDSQLRRAMEKIKVKNTQAAKESSSLLQQNTQLESKCRKLEEKLSACEATIEATRMKLSNAETELRRQRQAHQAELHTAVHNQQVAEAELVHQADAHTQREASILAVKQGHAIELAALQQSVEATQGDHLSEIAALTLRANEETTAAAAAERSVAALQVQLVAANAALEAANLQLERHRQHSAQEATRLRAFHDTDEAEAKHLRAELRKSQSELVQLQEVVDSEKSRRAALELSQAERLEKSESELQMWQRKHSHQVVKLERAQEQTRSLQLAASAAAADATRRNQLIQGQLRVSNVKVEGLEQELSAIRADMANVEEYNQSLKTQAVLVEAEARAMQVRFARISSEIAGVPLSHSQRKQLENQTTESLRKIAGGK